jgi:replicative DNA helicase
MLPSFIGVEDTAGHSTVTSLQALVQDVQPAVVFIDGVYLMTDEVTGIQGSADHQALTNISRSLKQLAKRQKISIIVSTQQLFGKVSKGRTSLAGIGYTSAFSQDADLLIGVESIEEQPDIATMRIHGNRSGPQGIEFQITWNLETGVVEEVGGGESETGAYDDIS